METRTRKASPPKQRRDTSRSRSRISRPSLPATAGDAVASSPSSATGLHRFHAAAGRRTSYAASSGRDSVGSESSADRPLRQRFPRYDPGIELRQVRERIPMYTDWAKQDELFETTRRDRQRYEAKQVQKRLSQSLNNSTNLNHSLNSTGSAAAAPADTSCFEMEDDESVLLRRQRDIDKTKNLSAYGSYVKSVPKPLREKCDPRTPNKFVRMSRRAWDGAVKQWKLQLHRWDDAATTASGGATPKSLSPSSSPSPARSADPPPAAGGMPVVPDFSGEEEDTRTLTAAPPAACSSSSVQPEALHSGLTSDVQTLAVAGCHRLTRKRSANMLGSPSKKVKH